MVAMIRPTLLLKMDLDEQSFSDDISAEIKRSYSYVSPTLVDSHQTEEFGPENIVRFMVKIRKPYWNSNDEGADELWSEVMVKWFTNMFYKISTTMVAYNNVRDEKGEPRLLFTWLDAELEDGLVVSLRLGLDSSIPEQAVDFVKSIRTAFNKEMFGGEKVACVRIPSRASLTSQGISTTSSKGGDSEVPSEASDEVTVSDADESSELEDGGGTQDESGEALSQIDYTVWGIEYEDGTVREFDSYTGELIS